MIFPLDYLILLSLLIPIITGAALGFALIPPRAKPSRRELRRIEREADAWRQAEWAERIE